MLLVIQIEKLHHQTLKDMEDEKEIIIIGKGLNLCFNDNYFEELEEKARKYDELIEIGDEDEKDIKNPKKKS
jgi:UDP-N-acetylenolpyruvoylglucosamine reductase